jgi:hypothetical protein
MLFAPMVAGATVALADGIDSAEFLAASGRSLGWLGGPVGLYILVLAAILTALSTGITRGLDRALVGYRAGRALICATVTYCSSYVLVGAVI